MEAYHDVASSYHNIGNTLIKMGNYQGALGTGKHLNSVLQIFLHVLTFFISQARRYCVTV